MCETVYALNVNMRIGSEVNETTNMTLINHTNLFEIILKLCNASLLNFALFFVNKCV